MAVYAPEYRLTVYQEDDVTPFGDPWTSVPGGSRPYLDAASVEWREDRIDLLRGESRIGEVAVRILDKRTGTDQADRVLTALLGDTEGNPRWNGLRAVLEWREGPSASWRTLKDGRIGSLTLERDLVTYRIHILDDRIGMLARAFTSGEGKFAYDYMRRWDAGLAPSYAAPGSLWPAGPLVPYIDATGVQGKPGTFRVLGSGPAPYAIDVGQVALSIPRNKALDTLTRATRRIGPYSVFRDLMVRIRRDSDGTVGYYFVLEQQPIALGGTREPERLLLVRDGAEPIFSEGDVVRFWVMPYGEPSEYAPFHWRAHPARFVADLLAGHFGPYRQGAPARAIRYDAARLAALEADGYWPTMRDRITSPARIYDYLREAIFGALGWADGIDDQGRVYILTHRPPTSLAGLPVLDGSRVSPPEDAPWRNPGTEAIAQVVFEGRLEQRAQPSEDAPPDLIEEVEHRFIALSSDAYGRLSEREERLPARALRSTGPASPDVTRWVDTYSAFLRRQQARGPQIVVADVPWRYADQLGLRVGGHVIGQIPWIPDPVTNRRGGTRVYQVQGVQQRGGLVRLTLFDLGGNAFAQQPTASAVAKNAGAPYDAVDVTLTVPSGVIADVWTAETSTSVSTRPPETSPLWRPKVQSGLGQNGVYTARDHAAGSRVWIRYRGIPSGQDKLPSPWRYPTNDGRPTDYIDLDARPEFFEVRVAPGDAPGQAIVSVRVNAAAKGVRVEYGPTPSLGSTINLDTTSGTAQTTLWLPPGSLAHLRLTAYPQFPIGGTAGEVREATVQVPAAPAALFSRARVVAQSPSTLTVRVAVADPVDPTRTGDATITYTQSGTGGVTPGSPQVVPAATIRDTLDASEAAGGYVDFTVTRPAPGAGAGQVAFTAQRIGRAQATATVEVAERPPAVLPTVAIDQIQVTPVGLPALARSDVSFRVTDPTGAGGTLRAWLPGAGGNPNPTAVPDATLTIASTPRTVGPANVWTLTAGGTGQILNDLWSGSHYQPYLLVEFVSSTGASTGQVQIFLPPRTIDPVTGQPNQNFDVPKKAQIVEAMNGQEWGYGDLYSEPPVVAYVGGGLTWDNRNRWGTIDLTYNNGGKGSATGSLTLSQYGIIPRFFGEVMHDQRKIKFHAFLMAVGTTTPRTATFASPQQVGLGNLTGVATLPASQLPAAGNNYTVRWRFRVEPDSGVAGGWSAAAFIEVYTGAGLVAATWTPTVKGSGSTAEEISGSVAFQREFSGATNELVQIKFANLLWQFDVGGAVPGTSFVEGLGVDWTQAAGALYASATPTDADRARFLILAQR